MCSPDLDPGTRFKPDLVSSVLWLVSSQPLRHVDFIVSDTYEATLGTH